MLDVKLGATVNFQIDGHSSINGALIPEGSTVLVEGNNPEVAVPGTVQVPPGGAQTLILPVTILAAGSVDWHATVTDPAGNVFEATDTLTVEPGEPGLVRITAAFVPATPTP